MTYDFTEEEIFIIRQLVDGIRVSPRQVDAESVLRVSKQLATKLFPERDTATAPAVDAEVVNP